MTRNVLRHLNVAGFAVVIGLVLVWWAIKDFGIIDVAYLPSPIDVFRSLVDMVGSTDVWSSLGYTLRITLTASLIAVVIGFPLGAALGLLPVVHTYLMASLDVFRSIPIIALMPVALLIWGASPRGEIILATLSALWPFVISTMGGVGTTHPRLFEVARVFRLTPAATVRKIVIPASVPAVLVGARLAVISAFIIAIVAEMLVSAKGLGWDLVLAQQGLDPARLWALAVTAGIVGYLINVAMVRGTVLLMPQMATQIDNGVAA